ncbi:S-adenosyl-L-methionine-dependent methyltransferase [Atractiella rhizophila]|nr:S-adenosyl-L-methionine-dependent methyltransferase [Atractiella rhizophila]
MQKISDQFHNSEVAQQYREFERGTSIPGRRLLEKSGVFSQPLPFEGLNILDNACGTGVITALIKNEKHFENVEITATDISEAMLHILEGRIKEEGWNNVSTKVANAMDLKLPSNTFSHTLTNFCFMMVPEPVKAIQEAIRVTKPGGVIGFTTWNSLGWFPPANEAISRLPGPPPIQDPTRPSVRTGDWYSSEYVSKLLQSPPLSLEDVQVELYPCKFKVDSAHKFAYGQYGQPMFINLMTMTWSEEQKKELKEQLKESLEQVLVERYGTDSPFELDFVAVICTGRKPTAN